MIAETEDDLIKSLNEWKENGCVVCVCVSGRITWRIEALRVNMNK